MIRPRYNPHNFSALAVIGGAMNAARAAGRVLTITGHTDATGPENYNAWLSKRRAQAVKAHLVREHNVNPLQLLTQGKGERELYRPSEPYGRINRRVAFQAAW